MTIQLDEALVQKSLEDSRIRVLRIFPGFAKGCSFFSRKLKELEVLKPPLLCVRKLHDRTVKSLGAMPVAIAKQKAATRFSWS